MLLPIVAGGPGDQFNESTDQRGHILGGRMIFADGRAYRYAGNGAVLLVQGDVQQSSVAIADHVLQTPNVAGVIGDKTLEVTMGSTAVVIDQYKDGYMNIPIGTAQGQVYTIKAHGAVASAAEFTVPLFESLQTAVPTTANSISLVANQYKGVIQSPTTLTGAPVGVAVSALAASSFGWLQVVGPASVNTKGTVIRGHNAAILVTQAGSIGPAAADTSFVIGVVLNIAADGANSLINLNIC